MDRAQQDTWNSQISNQKRLKSNDSDDEHRKIKRHKRSCSKETSTKHQESSKSDDERHKSSRLKEMSTKRQGSSDSDKEHHKSNKIKYHQSRRSKKKSKEHRYFEASPRQSTSDYAKKRHDIARSERRFDEYNVALNNLKHASTDFNEHHGRRLTSSAGDANVIVISDSDGGDPNQNVIVVTSSPEMDKIQGSILQNFFVISAAGIPLLNQKFIV